ncbi:MAG: fatty acid CoA ligase family protein [Oleibacter sp.]|nr:fatty acid CoA ligase family protein [Thalassolituus sp.]
MNVAVADTEPLGERQTLFNVFSLLEEQARIEPEKLAMIQAGQRNKHGQFEYRKQSFAKLVNEIESLSAGFAQLGIGQGSKVLILVKPDIQLVSVTYALFRLGAIPVIIDPAIGFSRLLHCIEEAAPDALLALPLVHAIRPLFPRTFKSVRIFITNGCKISPRVHRLQKLMQTNAPVPAVAPTHSNDVAAIFFTSGSTGIPKGVESQHGHMRAQINIMRDLFDFDRHETDLAAFPVTMLVSPALGRTCVVPNLGSLHPAKCKPENLVQAISDFNVAACFASPIVWERLSLYCTENNLQLSSIHCAYSGGAPIPGKLVKRVCDIIPNGRMLTPYGATEATPIAIMDAEEILAETAQLTTKGHGVCVGRPVAGLQVLIISQQAEAIADFADITLLPQGQRGEIITQGPLVSERYHGRDEATRMAKITELDKATGATRIWHRTGDIGYFDDKGRLWFCGRISHITYHKNQAFYSVQAEEIVNAEVDIWRSALVNVEVNQEQELVIVLEPHSEHRKTVSTERQQRILQTLHAHGFPVKFSFVFPQAFPVDRRHNSKIERPTLAEWAQKNMIKGVTLL